MSLMLLVASAIVYDFIFISFPINLVFSFFFFNDTATTEIYTLSLHDALPICHARIFIEPVDEVRRGRMGDIGHGDRKSTRLNSSHLVISYAVFCLKKKKRDHHAHPLSLPRRHDSDSRVGSSTLRHYTERRVTL